MDDGRQVEAYCDTCKDVRHHHMQADDPGSCTCGVCGTTQQMMVPLA